MASAAAPGEVAGEVGCDAVLTFAAVDDARNGGGVGERRRSLAMPGLDRLDAEVEVVLVEDERVIGEAVGEPL